MRPPVPKMESRKEPCVLRFRQIGEPEGIKGGGVPPKSAAEIYRQTDAAPPEGVENHTRPHCPSKSVKHEGRLAHDTSDKRLTPCV